MSVSQPTVGKGAGAPGSERSRRAFPAWAKWLFWGTVLAVGIGAGAGVALLSRSTSRASPAAVPRTPIQPAAVWPRGARPAPDFRLTDQHGRPFSLGGLRGRPVLVTFIDPLCRNLCPLEARVLSDAVRRAAPADRPLIAAVSVNPWGDAPQNMRQDAAKWKLAPQWRWGIGTHAELARVWHDYAIGVQVAKRTIAGVTVREIAHTEATYLVDSSGHERAVFLYPFRAADVLRTLRRISRGA
jgi:cytochrome oxidase Cu insertion factor (SCO1/SenC/PrrC family)